MGHIELKQLQEHCRNQVLKKTASSEDTKAAASY